MSDNWLQFIPTNPHYLPSREAAETPRELLAAFTPHADTVTVMFKEMGGILSPWIELVGCVLPQLRR
jgi:hypothetical protein